MHSLIMLIVLIKPRQITQLHHHHFCQQSLRINMTIFCHKYLLCCRIRTLSAVFVMFDG